MTVTVTCYGGVNEIGGNKILVTDRGTKVFLDFGAGFSEGLTFFSSGIEPRRVNGAGDYFEFGILPEISGLYSEEALQNTKLKHVAPEVDAAHWLLYLVHLGTRFSRSACDAIVEDLRRERIEAYPFCRPLHTQRHYVDHNPANRRGKLLVTEKLADRAVALPFHRHLSEQQIAFIVSTLKDASTNVGAGAAIF